MLDINDGVVLYPGVDQLANFAAKVDLEAQVTGTTVSSYNWDTSGLGGDISNLSVTNTYQLTFNWPTTNPGAGRTNSVTLSVEDTNSHFETFTYDFYLPHGSGSSGGSGGGNATWPTSLAPSSELLSAPAFASDNASVDAASGALDTEIDLPSYNPNVAAHRVDL